MKKQISLLAVGILIGFSLSFLSPGGSSSELLNSKPEKPSIETTQKTRFPITLTRVVDGDTLWAEYNGLPLKIRLLFINTVERGQKGYKEATAALKGLLENKTLEAEFQEGHDKVGSYGRYLCYIFADGKNVNVEMVRLGHTEYWTKYGKSASYEKEFLKAQEIAKKDEKQS